MMKVLLISSSPRREKSQTLFLAKQVLEGCLENKDAESEVIHLCDLKIEFCRHCEACHKKILACKIKDDVSMILGKMLKAQGIILASPNYINQVTGSMKTLFDRSSHFIHCKRLSGKYIVGVVSSGSGRDRGVLDYIKFYAHTCGAQYSGGASNGRQIGAEKNDEAFALGRKLASDIKEKKEYPQEMRLLESGKEYFKEKIKARKDEWVEEYQYWCDQGWL
jgi:multimeric flavodoxin WrbA